MVFTIFVNVRDNVMIKLVVICGAVLAGVSASYVYAPQRYAPSVFWV